jgi:PAS domain S-box-containing protein
VTRFGDFIRARREELRKGDPEYSLRRVAARLGVQPAYLSRMERAGDCALTEAKTRVLAEILDLDPDLLLALSGKLPEVMRECAFRDPAAFAQRMGRLRAAEEPCGIPEGLDDLAPALAQRILDTLPDMVFWADAAGRYLYANAAACAALGYTQAELVGASLLDVHLVPAGYWHAHLADLRSNGTVRQRTRLRRKDGGVLLADIVAFLLTVEGRELIVATARDITERMRLEFDRKLARYSFETAPSMIVWVTPDCRFLDVNTAALDELGYTREELLAISPLDVHVLRTQAEWPGLWEMARRGEDLYAESIWARKDGSRFPVELTGNLLQFDGNEYAVIYARDITARQALERDLRLSQVTVERAADMIFWVDATGSIINVNRAACTALGYEREEVLRLCAWEVNQGRSPERWNANWQALLRLGAVGMESAFLRKDGGLIDVELNSSLVEHEGRELMVTIARDVTERRRLEERLSLQQHALRRVPDMVFWAQEDGRFSIVNPAAAAALGYSEDELLGLRVWDVDVDTSPRRWARHWGLFFERESLRGEVRLRRKDGSFMLVELLGSGVEHQGRRMVVAVCRDITERKALEERLRMTQHAVDHAPEAILWNGPDGRIQDCNHAALTLSGYSREECLGLRVPDLFPSTTIETWEQRWETLRARGSLSSEGVLRRKDGVLVPVESIVEHQAYAGREFNVAFLRDMTERKLDEERLLAAKRLADAASRAKSEFLANMSHEIRTPLNGVLGMLQVLEISELDASQRDCVETALHSGRSLLSLINDILDFSKVEAGKLSIANDPFSPEAVVGVVRSIFQHLAQTKGLSLGVELDPSLPEQVRGDAGRLRQVLFNLLGNAVKFTNRGGISLRAWAEPVDEARLRLRFIIRDTGIGIPQDKLEQVFEAFVQVDGDITRNFQGTGLGLSIVRRLVGLMGGEVRLESEPGQGCTARFDIVAGRMDAQAKAEDSRDRCALTARPLTVLVAEDSEVNRKALAELLRALGHTALAVEDGQQALQALRAARFDLVLMDIRMPVMDGIEATQAIRADASLGEMRSVPIVAVTAHALAGDRERFLAAGMNDYLPKPVVVADLSCLLARLSGRAAG